jgi:hypothetical protein
MTEIPWIPSSPNPYSNPAVVQLPATQTNETNVNETQIDPSAIDPAAIDKFQKILLYSSICFTFSQVILSVFFNS